MLYSVPPIPESRIIMPQSAAAPFLAAARVFSRSEYAAAVGRGPDDPAVDAMLARHVRAGEIKHVAGDVFGTVPEGDGDPNKYPVPHFLVPAKLRPGAVLAYRSALYLHGMAYSITTCVTHAFVPAGAGEITADGQFYEFYEPAPGLVLGGERPADGIEVITFMDVDVRLTTVERTLADLFARPAMGGDTLIESLDFADDIDGAAVVRHMRALNNPAAAGAMGFWLESRRDRYSVADAALRDLRALAPRSPVYALGGRPQCACLPAGSWNVIVPERLVERVINGESLLSGM